MEDLDRSVVCQGIYFSFVKNVTERKEVLPLIFLFKRFQAAFEKDMPEPYKRRNIQFGRF